MRRLLLGALFLGVFTGCGGPPISDGSSSTVWDWLAGLFAPDPAPSDRFDDAGVTEDPAEPEEEPPPLEEPEEIEPPPEPAPEETQARHTEEARVREEVLESSELLKKIIGTTGQPGGSHVEDLWVDDGAGLDDIDEALTLGGRTTDVPVGSRGGSRGSRGGSGNAAGIGDLVEAAEIRSPDDK